MDMHPGFVSVSCPQGVRQIDHDSSLQEIIALSYGRTERARKKILLDATVDRIGSKGSRLGRRRIPRLAEEQDERNAKNGIRDTLAERSEEAPRRDCGSVMEGFNAAVLWALLCRSFAAAAVAHAGNNSQNSEAMSF